MFTNFKLNFEADPDSMTQPHFDLRILKKMTKGLGCLRDKNQRMSKLQVKCIN